MNITYRSLIKLLVIAALFSGCKSYESRLKKDYGNSHRIAIENQTLTPQAVQNPELVYGIDGKTADIIVKSFQKSFEEREREPKFPLDVIQIQHE